MNKEQFLNAIQYIESNIELPKYVREVFSLVKSTQSHSKVIDQFLIDYGINESIAKVDFLNITIEYIKLIIEQNAVTEENVENVQLLKILFQIKPGDFFIHKKNEIENLIKYQLAKIYDDNLVSPDEAILKVEIQQLFDLSFDQMNNYAKSEAVGIIQRGIDPRDLDLTLSHNEYFTINSNNSNY
jgi:hypothetical protein